MGALDWVAALLIVIGAVFFLAGTAGLLRFPDTFSRLHALTKADNLGLGFTIAGLGIQGASLALALKLVFIWLLALLAGSTVCFLVGRSVLRKTIRRDESD
jgi:multicomponent Na+:H+ antiporter subunit G